MHSSRMRTVHNSSCLLLGGLHTCPPPSRHPRSRLPPGPVTPLGPGTLPPEQAPPLWDQAPPGTSHPLPETCCKASWDATCNACWDSTPLGPGTPPGPGTPLDTCCKVCWDATCNAYWDSTPPLLVDRMTGTCKNITFVADSKD